MWCVLIFDLGLEKRFRQFTKRHHFHSAPRIWIKMQMNRDTTRGAYLLSSIERVQLQMQMTLYVLVYMLAV